MVDIKEERLRREALSRQQDLVRQRESWDRHRARRSPDARRSGRRSTEWEDRSSRSRSPRTCRLRAQQESSTIRAVDWEYEIEALDPPIEQIVHQARAAILEYYNGRTLETPETWQRGAADGLDFYVGVTRYIQRRWYGGVDLEPEDGHRHKWRRLYFLSTHSVEVGLAEDALIKHLRREFGPERCAHKRGGGGGAAASKPNMLYVCVGRASA